MSPRRSRRARAAVSALLVVAAVAGCVDEAAGPAPGVADPAFYVPPEPFPPGEPGDILRVEEIKGLDTEGELLRVLYRSESLAGAPIAVSGVIAVPPGEPPAGGWPVLSLAHGTVGVADACAPSFNPTAQAGDLAAEGYVVVASDYEGLGTPGRHPYLVGESEARGVIDAVRAARALGNRVGAGSRYVVLGYSQGGHAALFANEIAATWAPELTLVGTVAGAPVVELDTFVGELSPAFDWLEVLMVAGMEAVDPAAAPASVLSPAGLDLFPVVDERCSTDVMAAYEGGGALKADLRTTPPFASRLAADTPGQRPGASPVLLLGGGADELIGADLLEQALARLCSVGQVVERRTYPGVDHAGSIAASLDDAVAWAKGAFTTTPTTSSCP
jgi:alpha-beta hydrolase superfamily lysophospholipase